MKRLLTSVCAGSLIVCLSIASFVHLSPALAGDGVTMTAATVALDDSCTDKKKVETKVEELTPDVILKKAGDALFPEDFTAKLEMTAVKPGNPNTISQMKLYKSGADRVRSDYEQPIEQAGQRMLRKEGQIWLYMPDTKRAVKLSPKQSLGGSDFSNGDLMRLNLEQDYIPRMLEETDTQWVLELKAKDNTVSYDMIKYTVEKKEFRSVRQEFYTLSGKLIKTMEFKDYKDYAGFKRPSLFVMSSALAKGVYTEMRYLEFQSGKTLPANQFTAEALSKN